MWNRIKHWWRAEGALVRLQGASDRMLADMGLNRADLRARVVGQTAQAVAPARPDCGTCGLPARGRTV